MASDFTFSNNAPDCSPSYIYDQCRIYYFIVPTIHSIIWKHIILLLLFIYCGIYYSKLMFSGLYIGLLHKVRWRWNNFIICDCWALKVKNNLWRQKSTWKSQFKFRGQIIFRELRCQIVGTVLKRRTWILPMENVACQASWRPHGLWVAQNKRPVYWGSPSNSITPNTTKLFSCTIMLVHMLPVKIYLKHSIGKTLNRIDGPWSQEFKRFSNYSWI